MPQLVEDKADVFQHDGASTQIHSEAKTFLVRQLLERWICRGGGGPLPAPAIS
jgi:hypothetical protein